jgi:hypothetical protein
MEKVFGKDLFDILYVYDKLTLIYLILFWYISMTNMVHYVTRNSQLIVKMTIFNVLSYHILLYYIMEQN